MERSVAIVGAGIAGLTAARTLVQAGCRVLVFEKARGPGGRLSTRRAGPHAFDLGTQSFSVQDTRVKGMLADWFAGEVIARWDPHLAVLADGVVRPWPTEEPRYVGVPRMSALTRHLAEGLDVRPRTCVTQVERRDGAWELAAGYPLGRFDAVLVTTPPEQAVPLLAAAPTLARTVEGVRSQPCWAVMAAFPEPLDVTFDAASVHGGPLMWVARDASKPGREPHATWVLHATHDWSRAHLDDAPSEVAPALLDGFFKAAGCAPATPDYLDAHRWALAMTEEPLEVDLLWDPELGIGACGDWCASGRVEGAVLSGLAAGEQVARGMGLGTGDPA